MNKSLKREERRLKIMIIQNKKAASNPAAFEIIADYKIK
jgi:hypothetical protein